MSTTTRVLAGLGLGLLVGLLCALAGDGIAERVAAIVAPVGTPWLNALRMTVCRWSAVRTVGNVTGDLAVTTALARRHARSEESHTATATHAHQEPAR